MGGRWADGVGHITSELVGEETGGATGTVADPGGAPPDAVGEVRATQVGTEILWFMLFPSKVDCNR